MAIGGTAKRRWLADYARLAIDYEENKHSIAFTSLQDDVFLLDCELHLQIDQTLPRLKAGLATEERRALLACAARQTQDIAFSLYSDLLSHFSGVVLLFVSDFGGISQVINFLCSWLGRAMPRGFPTLTRIVLLHDTRPPPDGETAIQQFAHDPSIVFDAISASRLQYTVPGRIQESLNSFLKCAGDALESDSILSSALVMDAYPPGMHTFSPDAVFDRLYKGVVVQCESALGLYGLVESIKYRFVAIATHNLRLDLDAAQAHREVVRKCRFDGRAKGSCNFCIVQPPTHTLGCQHRLCSSCIVALGSETSRWYYQLESCPLCEEQQQPVFPIKPPTAADRVLVLGGEDAEGTWQFLKDLERTVGLRLIDLRIFFAFAIFLEGWSLYDCKYHLARMRPRKIRRGTAIFGDKLAWKFQEIQRSNDTTIVIDTGKDAMSNRHASVVGARSTDIFVQHYGGTYNSSLLATISSQLLANLFYIELGTMPDASRSFQYCPVMLRCRIPPGQSLVDLLNRLHRENTLLYYQGFGVSETREELCTEAVLWEGDRHRPFLRTIMLPILSVETEARIQIDGLDGQKHCISNCPYKLEQLIQDQEMDHVFGRRDRKCATEAWVTAAQAEQELKETLNNI
ncbi:hypothetical protein FSARC_11365 [Fusarium sarcochroum]|uniref:RING-type domain-containing protein n=1 Tax=Fusarium sarcochroum TaxID=1208366 RepID=A0A8H4TFV6_9HYPO|nr:hypothetical protein FSARC_11365 [Fusarium sarcochroum]